MERERHEEIIDAGAKVKQLRERRAGMLGVRANHEQLANEARARLLATETAIAQLDTDIAAAEAALRSLLT